MAHLAKNLVQSVVRAFYDIEHTVIIDALVLHLALSLNELALVMELSRHNKVVSKLCGKLREGGLISVYARQEQRDPLAKPTSREYFYIDYRRAIDAIKYRVHVVDEKVKNAGKVVGDRKELFCRRCEAEYTHMEVLDNIDPLGRGSGFLCKRCDNLLDIRDPEEDAAKEVNDRPAFFNKQFECIINLLHKIDAHTIPATDPEALLNDARVMLNNAYLTTSANERLKARSQLNAVRGIQTGPEKIEISITNPADGQSAEDVAEMERRVRIAEQNRLPEWHTKSTIFNNGPAPSQSAQAAQSLDVKPVVDVKNTATEETEKDGLDSYFATLQAEQDIWEAVKDEGFDDDDDDENEDEEGES